MRKGPTSLFTPQFLTAVCSSSQQFWQLYNSFTLFKMFQLPECKEWQVSTAELLVRFKHLHHMMCRWPVYPTFNLRTKVQERWRHGLRSPCKMTKRAFVLFWLQKFPVSRVYLLQACFTTPLNLTIYFQSPSGTFSHTDSLPVNSDVFSVFWFKYKSYFKQVAWSKPCFLCVFLWCRFWCVAALTWCSSWETSSPHWQWFIRNTWTTRTSPRACETRKKQEINEVQRLSSCRKSPNSLYNGT